MAALLAVLLACLPGPLAGSPGDPGPAAAVAPARVITLTVSAGAAPVACSGCTPSLHHDLRSTIIRCNCDDSGPTFGHLEIRNEGQSFHPCSGFFSCSSDGCEWHYDVALVLNDDRPADCFPGGVYWERNGPRRSQAILSSTGGRSRAGPVPASRRGRSSANSRTWSSMRHRVRRRSAPPSC